MAAGCLSFHKSKHEDFIGRSESLWCVAWVLKLSRRFGQAFASLTLVSAKHLVHHQKPSSNFLASALQLYYIFMASLENCMQLSILKRGK